MRRQSSRLIANRGSDRPLTRSMRGQLVQPINNRYQHLLNALQTLDRSHAFMLLKTSQELNQELLCWRTQLAHQLNQHQYCLSFAKGALTNYPSCKGCLGVYLSHAENIPSEDLPLSQEIMKAIQEQGPEYLNMIPGLLKQSPNSQRYFGLVERLKRDGSLLDKIAVMEGGYGRKVIAVAKIEKNQQILFVPHSQLITLQLARTLPLVEKLITAKVPLRSPKHTQLAILLLQHMELGKESPFWAYLSTLPSDFSHFPINYPEQLMNQLRGTCFLQQVQHKRADMRKDYQAVLSIDEQFIRYSLTRFCQARLLVSSRVFGIVVDQIKTDALVPVADMLNHHLPKQTSWYYCDRLGGFVIQSLRQIVAGSEIFDSYGQKCNSRFLLNYGFVLPNNMHNQVVNLSLFRLLMSIWGRSLMGHPELLKLGLAGFLEAKGFDQMIGLLRATVDTDNSRREESEEEISMGLEALKQTPYKNRENEVLVWRTIESLVTDRLRDYPTSMLEDKRQLQTVRQSNLSNVITLRRGEKEVLTFYQTMSRRMSRFLLTEGRRGDVDNYQPYLQSIGLSQVM